MSRTHRYKSLALWSLAGLNLLLAGPLVGRLWHGTVAVAQSTGAPGDYLMIPGDVVGGTNAVVYVVNQTTHQLGAMSYDDSMKQLVSMAPRDLNRDFDNRNGGGAARGGGGHR